MNLVDSMKEVGDIAYINLKHNRKGSLNMIDGWERWERRGGRWGEMAVVNLVIVSVISIVTGCRSVFGDFC
jgi:hypothetical protein